MADDKADNGRGRGRGRRPKRPRDADDDDVVENWEDDTGGNDDEEDVEKPKSGAEADVAGEEVPENIRKYVKAMIKENISVKTKVDQLLAANRRLEEKVTQYKNSDEHKKLGYDVDLAAIKKKVAQLPPDGDISGFLYETSLGASVFTAKSMGDDSFNASFISRLSVEAKLDST